MSVVTGTLLSQVVAVVTGGARGLGLAITRALLAEGGCVFVVDIDPVAKESIDPRAGDRLLVERIDVTREADVERAVRHCEKSYGHVGVLVNNAGLIPDVLGLENPPMFWELDKETLERFISVHAIGSFLMARAVVRPMLSMSWGRIITVTTNFRTMLNRAPYGPAKSAMESLASVMARDLAGTGVTSNVVIPGGSAANSPERIARFPVGSLVDPNVMGPPVVWLASRLSDGINGRRFVANAWTDAIRATDSAIAASSEVGWLSLDPKGQSGARPVH